MDEVTLKRYTELLVGKYLVRLRIHDCFLVTGISIHSSGHIRIHVKHAHGQVDAFSPSDTRQMDKVLQGKDTGFCVITNGELFKLLYG